MINLVPGHPFPSSTSTSNLSLSHHHHLLMMETSSSSPSMKLPALIKWGRTKRPSVKQTKRKRSPKIYKLRPLPALQEVRIPLTKRELDDDFADRPSRKTDKLFPGSTLPRVITMKRYD